MYVQYLLDANFLPGTEILTIVSYIKLPCKVERPMSMLFVAATSNKQKGSPPQLVLAWRASSGVAKIRENAGTKVGPKKVEKLVPLL